MATSTIRRDDNVTTLTVNDGLTFNTKLEETGPAGTYAQKIGAGRKLVCVCINFALKANQSLTYGEVLVSGLPKPERLVSFNGAIRDTLARLQIRTNGTLTLDGAYTNANSSAYFDASVTYLAASAE